MNENPKQKIMRVATHLFAHKGFDTVSVREICRQADVNVCMIAYYFGGKQELYNGIINELVERQRQYVGSLFDLDLEPRELEKHEQIDLLERILDKFVDFFYNDVSKDLVLLLLKEQQNPQFNWRSPAFEYLYKVVAAAFDLKENSREAVYQTLFIIVQIGCLRVLPAFSFRLLERSTFDQDDIDMIKDNVKRYVKLMLVERGVDLR